MFSGRRLRAVLCIMSATNISSRATCVSPSNHCFVRHLLEHFQNTPPACLLVCEIATVVERNYRMILQSVCCVL